MTIPPPSPEPAWAAPAAYVVQALDAAAIVARTDARGRITHCNDMFCEVSGYSREALLGANHRILNSGTHAPEFFRDMYAAISGGRTWKGTICNRRRDGELYWVDTTIVPQLGANGRPVAYLAIRFDVTGHVRALQDLAEARARAEAALDVKGRIVANMSHELRTPLSGILGMAQLLEETPLRGDQHDFVRAILEASRSLQGLVDDVLKLAQLEAGAAVVSPQAVDPSALARSVVTLLEPRASEKGLTLSLGQGRLPRWVRIDPLRTRQVLTNLIGNAIKFTDRGGVTANVEWRDDHLLFSVEDTGPGFPASEKERLFRAFEQGEDARTRPFGGAGLGLAISRELVRAMGGSIDAESSPGSGARFHFSIPARRARASRTAHPDPAVTSQSGPALSVLVAEDNPTLQQVLRHLLGAMSCEVTMASDGREAVEAVLSRSFDLCLMDLRMPRLDGFAAMAQIRPLPNAVGLPIVALSADVVDGRTAVCATEGFDGFLGKPIDAKALAGLLAARREALSNPASEQVHREAKPA